MKKVLIAAIFLSAIISFSFLTIPDSRFTGKWKGVSQSEVGYINFDKEGYVSFTVNGETMGGKEFVVEGQVLRMSYEINDTLKPKGIDIIVSSATTNKETKRVKGIFEFLSDTKVRMNINFDGAERPKSFGVKDDNTLIFDKVKE